MFTEEKGPEEWLKVQERCGRFLSEKCEDQGVTEGTQSLMREGAFVFVFLTEGLQCGC